ncbi:helix-turn-helix transcriptional regulator [Sphingopyxis sp.]|uniref:helix-turn-helix transcriptional regulator n=1 Tax=Sphingopyxis sp. TaxID=1908224 RepID=UPI0035B16D46
MTAALQPDRWIEALDTMARHTGASHGQLIGIGGVRDVMFNLATNFEPSAFAKFVQVGGGSPDTNFRIAASQRHIARGLYDPILHEHHYDEVIPDLSSRQYVDWCEEIDVPFGCQTNLVIDGFGLVGFATLRKRKEGRTTARQRGIFSRAAEAARRAVRLQERLEGEQARLLAGAYDAIGICAFILDARGRVLAHTNRAADLLSAGDVRLSGSMLDADARPMPLRKAIDALVANGGLPNIRVRIELPSERPPLLVEGFRLPAESWSFGRLPHAVLIVNAPRRDRAGVGQMLALLYGLTAAEADIAMRLFDGKSRSQIAAERGVVAETLRGQIKRIHAKCAVDGEAALMRLLAAFFI